MVDIAYQPLSKAWDRAKLVLIKELNKVTPGQVDFIDSHGSEQTLKADGIVVATGSIQSSPLMKDSLGLSKEERKAQFNAFRNAMDKSQGFLCIGGGSTGTELVAEVATDFPNVKCTLVNKPELLLRELMV